VLTSYSFVQMILIYFLFKFDGINSFEKQTKVITQNFACPCGHASNMGCAFKPTPPNLAISMWEKVESPKQLKLE
jgi:hypothetical protein